jgi:hypothetical protein
MTKTEGDSRQCLARRAKITNAGNVRRPNHQDSMFPDVESPEALEYDACRREFPAYTISLPSQTCKAKATGDRASCSSSRSHAPSFARHRSPCDQCFREA